MISMAHKLAAPAAAAVLSLSVASANAALVRHLDSESGLHRLRRIVRRQRDFLTPASPGFSAEVRAAKIHPYPEPMLRGLADAPGAFFGEPSTRNGNPT